MNSSSSFSGWKLCPMLDGNPKIQYVCYITEQCCETGCCTIYDYTHFKSWYFWLMVTLMFLIFFSCAWFCKKLEKKRRKREREQTPNRSIFSSTTQSLQNSPRILGDTIRLVDCLENIRNKKEREREDPPKYDEALTMPKTQSTQVVQIHYNNDRTANSNSDDVINNFLPSYDDAKRYETDKF